MKEPVVEVKLLIRKPADQVFEAFVDPSTLTRFWLARASARLEAGKRVDWDFQIEGASATIDVKEVVAPKRIVIEWDEGERVEWSFEPRPEGRTFVTIRHSGLHGDDDAKVAKALDSTQGFTLVLCNLKSLLERGESLRLMHDHFPDKRVRGSG